MQLGTGRRNPQPSCLRVTGCRARIAESTDSAWVDQHKLAAVEDVVCTAEWAINLILHPFESTEGSILCLTQSPPDMPCACA